MPIQTADAEVNTFVGGLVTDASPLTFPDNASIAETNFVLDSDGTRRRRQGMDLESSASSIVTGLTLNNPMGHSSYRWENAGGDPDKSLLVVQFGNQVKFFDLDNDPISQTVIDTINFDASTYSKIFSYAQVDGILVIANGNKDVEVFEYDDSTTSITRTQTTLRIRDLFGVEDVADGVDLRDSNNVSLRQTTETDAHLYNLRNQSWGVPRRDDALQTLADPITKYKGDDSNRLPSNADTVTFALFPDANNSGNRIVDRFFPEFVRDNPPGNSHAATGHFIIDALNRGTSRLEAHQGMIDKYSNTTMIDINTLPLDTTPGGADVVVQYSGHIFYAGFSGDVTSGDAKSPRMSSYVLFSRLVRDTSDIGICYQEGDPTSDQAPDVQQTDGGFIRIDEAYGIRNMWVANNSLFIFAENGVWQIVGDDNAGFKATGFTVTKITDRGTVGPASVVGAKGAIYYWGDDGIYVVTQNEFGDWGAESITQDRIQNFYDGISSLSKTLAQGYFDSYDDKIRWVYDNKLDDTWNVKELVIDLSLNAFFTNEIYSPTGADLPKVIGLFESSPFTLSTEASSIVVDGDPVQVNGDPVQISITALQSTTRSVKYVIVTDITDITYSFGSYNNSDFVDFKSIDGVGTDAQATMITGYISGGDFSRQKILPMLTVHCLKTENGFTQTGDVITPLNESSCKVQAQWAWSDDIASNRWGTEFQAYRIRRPYFPANVSDSFETGQVVVSSKNKIRGIGPVISFQFKSEPLKDLKLLGWGFTLGVLQRV